ATASRQAQFLSLRALGRRVNPHDPEQAHQTAQAMVGDMFFAPMLEEMRKLPFGKKISFGGRGEEAFGEQLDQLLAQKGAQRDQSGLVKQIAHKILPPPDRTSAPGGPHATT